MKASITTFGLGLLVSLTTILPGEMQDWPVIEPTEYKQTYVNPGKEGADTPFLLFLKNSKGVPLYRVECHNGNYEGSSELNFSGDFQCALFAIKNGRRTSWNLLATETKAEQRSDWLNRGRMTSNQLWEECGLLPEYGRVRHFRLRGMLITFRFTGLHWSPEANQRQHKLDEFTFEISAVPDKNAESSNAATVKGSAPPSSCN